MKTIEYRKTEIVDVTEICRSLPDPPIPEIMHDQVITTIDGYFHSDVSLVVIEGPAEIGKTTFLSQLSRKYCNRAISLFVRHANRWSYDYNLCLFDLCNQAHWILKGKELYDTTKADEALLGSLFLELRQKARKTKEYFVFVIDGLDDIPDIDYHTIESIIQILPWGFDAFKFVLSGKLAKYRQSIPAEISFRHLRIYPFSLDETKKYLADIRLTSKQVRDLYQLFHGYPGQLATARRLLLKGIDPEKIIDTLPEEIYQLYNIEWESSGPLDEDSELLLALLVYDRRPHNIESLCRLLGIDRSRCESYLQRFDYLIAESQNNTIEFVSDAFRKFAAGKLAHRQSHVYDTIIKNLLKTINKDESREILPDYLKEAERFDELLEFLSPEHLKELVSESQSLLPVRRKAALGIEASLAQNRDGELLRFGLGESSLREILSVSSLDSEVKAYAEVGEFHKAMTLAQSGPTKEDRLRLLSSLARVQREKGMPDDSDIEEQIKTLADQIDIAELGEVAIDIASDIICVFPEIAIELIEKASLRQTEEDSLDWAFARVSLKATLTQEKRLSGLDPVKMLRSRIKDPNARQLSTTALLLFSECSAADVISEIVPIEKTADKLMLARLWLRENPKNKDADELLSYALSILIKTTEFAPNAAVYRDLSFPLPFIVSDQRRKELILTFESQARTVEPLGPTEDYVELLLLLARAEKRSDKEKARERLVEVYLYISEISDLSTKASCIAKFLSYITIMDPDQEYENKDQLHSLSASELNEALAGLLQHTADHYAVCRGIIEALSPGMPEQAMKVAQALNTQYRRDKAFGLIARSMADTNPDKIKFDTMWQVMELIADQDYRDGILTMVFRKIYERGLRVEQLQPEVMRFSDLTEEMRDPEGRCYVAGYLLSVIHSEAGSELEVIHKRLKRLLYTSWEILDEGWNKIDTAFAISKIVARTSAIDAKQFLRNAVELRQKRGIVKCCG